MDYDLYVEEHETESITDFFHILIHLAHADANLI